MPEVPSPDQCWEKLVDNCCRYKLSPLPMNIQWRDTEMNSEKYLGVLLIISWTGRIMEENFKKGQRKLHLLKRLFMTFGVLNASKTELYPKISQGPASFSSTARSSIQNQSNIGFFSGVWLTFDKLRHRVSLAELKNIIHTLHCYIVRSFSVFNTWSTVLYTQLPFEFVS